jgi:hypothetical protein
VERTSGDSGDNTLGSGTGNDGGLGAGTDDLGSEPDGGLASGLGSGTGTGTGTDNGSGSAGDPFAPIDVNTGAAGTGFGTGTGTGTDPLNGGDPFAAGAGTGTNLADQIAAENLKLEQMWQATEQSYAQNQQEQSAAQQDVNPFFDPSGFGNAAGTAPFGQPNGGGVDPSSAGGMPTTPADPSLGGSEPVAPVQLESY